MKFIDRITSKFLSEYKIALKNGLNVGQGVSVLSGVNFGSEPYLITIGDYSRISVDVLFVTHDGGTWAFRDLPKYEKVIKYGKIHVGAHTFIGARCIIMPGVTIGERCVIGAGSIVTKDIPDGSVAVGVPAQIIMTTEEYANKCLTTLCEYDEQAYLRDKRKYLTEWL